MATEKANDKITIRPMEPEDIDAILEIDRKMSGKRRAVTYKDLISGDIGGDLDLSFIGEVGGQVVGFVLARYTYIGEPVIEVGLIQIFGVDPDYWGKGIASKLVDSVLECCQSKNLKIVRVMVNERDSRLQDFFAHLGFHRGQLIDYTKTI